MLVSWDINLILEKDWHLFKLDLTLVSLLLYFHMLFLKKKTKTKNKPWIWFPQDLEVLLVKETTRLFKCLQHSFVSSFFFFSIGHNKLCTDLGTVKQCILCISGICHSLWVLIALHGKICHFNHFRIKSLNLRLLIIKVKKYLQMLWNTFSLSQLWVLWLSSIPGATVSSVVLL